jgi:endonuclease YncB( thermonuclease family)
MDKYGRLLVDVFATPASTTSFSTILVQDKLAYKYEGDTKLTEEQQYALLTSQ